MEENCDGVAVRTNEFNWNVDAIVGAVLFDRTIAASYLKQNLTAVTKPSKIYLNNW